MWARHLALDLSKMTVRPEALCDHHARPGEVELPDGCKQRLGRHANFSSSYLRMPGCCQNARYAADSQSKPLPSKWINQWKQL